MPSVINRLVHDDFKAIVDTSPSVILIDPAGLKASDSLALRRQLHDVGATMRQGKARILLKSMPNEIADNFERGGSLALVSGEDIAAAAKIINEVAKGEKLQLRGGVVEGQVVDAAGAKAIADLPTKHEARAMFVRAVRGPAVKLAKVLRLPYVRLARGLNKHKENQEDG